MHVKCRLLLLPLLVLVLLTACTQTQSSIKPFGASKHSNMHELINFFGKIKVNTTKTNLNQKIEAQWNLSNNKTNDYDDWMAAFVNKEKETSIYSSNILKIGPYEKLFIQYRDQQYYAADLVTFLADQDLIQEDARKLYIRLKTDFQGVLQVKSIDDVEANDELFYRFHSHWKMDDRSYSLSVYRKNEPNSIPTIVWSTALHEPF